MQSLILPGPDRAHGASPLVDGERDLAQDQAYLGEQQHGRAGAGQDEQVDVFHGRGPSIGVGGRWRRTAPARPPTKDVGVRLTALDAGPQPFIALIRARMPPRRGAGPAVRVCPSAVAPSDPNDSVRADARRASGSSWTYGHRSKPVRQSQDRPCGGQPNHR